MDQQQSENDSPTEPNRPERVEVYTDGGCKPNPGPGGWGALIRFDGREWFLSGNDRQTTNNQMELQAAIAALGTLNGLFGPCTVDLFTDSEYLRQGITSWIDGWEQNGWRTKGRQPVKNQEQWRSLHRLIQTHNVTWQWVKGHAGNRHNERADFLATEARTALTSDPFRHAPAPTGPVDVEMYVKASFNPSQRASGWGVVLRTGEHTRALSGQEAGKSSNALLIRGATEGLRSLTRPCAVLAVSDADYLVRGASQWIKGWLVRDWMTKDNKPVANRADWEELLAAMQPHQITWRLGGTDDLPDLALAGKLASGEATGAATTEGPAADS